MLDAIKRLGKREPLKAIAASMKVSAGGLSKRVERHRKNERIKGNEK